MSVFISTSARLQAAVAETERAGFAYVPSALSGAACRDLRSAVDRWPLTLREAPTHVGQVRQHAQTASIPANSWPQVPAIARLAHDLRRSLGSEDWNPNDATVMRFNGPRAGISPHRDHLRFVRLIAIFSLEGEGQLTIVADRAGEEVVAAFTCRPGDLMLLRGSAPDGGVERADPRPLHAVTGPPAGRRTSLAFRMDASGA
jgi:hypothetical protein